MIGADRKIKIAFVGTSCVGKTTLLDYYRQRYQADPVVQFVGEQATVYFQKNPGIKNRFSREVQGEIQKMVLDAEQSVETQNTRLIVCDRSVLDAVAYVLSQDDIDGANCLFNNVLHWLASYSVIFLLDPNDIPYEQNLIRDEDEHMRKKFHLAFLHLFYMRNIPYVLLSGTFEDRVRQVDEIVQLNLPPSPPPNTSQ